MSMSLGIVGCGKMAYAILKGLKTRSDLMFSEVYCCDIDSDRLDLFAKEFDTISIDLLSLFKNSSIIILAVKPAQIQEIIAIGAKVLSADQLVISIAAGIKIESIERMLSSIPVIRVMPNTPCMVGKGVSSLAAGSFAGPNDLEMAQKIFASVGMAIHVKEKEMDAITALAGSGPAFAFLVVEAMIDAGIKVGLTAGLSRDLVVNTILGSMQLLVATSDHPAVLREQVSSPAGTTIEGITVLEQKRVRAAFIEAVESATRRSIELGKMF